MACLLSSGARIVFFGDSVTDCDRNRTSEGDAGLGLGYVRLCHAMLQARHPELGLEIRNRGIGGDRIYDLERRLDKDVLELRPQIVSILIGINDTWQRYGDHKRTSPVVEFSDCYRRILKKITGTCDARLVLCEPFLLPVPEDRRAWREDLDPRIQAIRDLAAEFEAFYLPLDGLFAQAAARRPAGFWLPDGVHPSAAGHGLIARAWMDLVSGQ